MGKNQAGEVSGREAWPIACYRAGHRAIVPSPFQLRCCTILPNRRSRKVDTPRISIIIPTYNRPGFLAQAVQSVLAQTLPTHEIIIVDDGSPLSCAPAISNIASRDARIKLFKLETNRGVSTARNFGLEKSSGDFIIFLDDDDLLFPEMSRISYEHLQANPDSCVAYGWSCFFADRDCSENTQQETYVSFQKPDEILYINKYESIPTIEAQPFSALLQTCIQISSSMIRKKSLNGFLFPDDLRRAEDVYFWLRLAASGHKFLAINECLSFHRIHPLRSLSRTASADDLNLLYKKLSNSGMITNELDILLMHMRFCLRLRHMDRLQSLRHAAMFLRHFLRPMTIASQSKNILMIVISKLRRRRHYHKLGKALAEMRTKSC